MPGALLAGPWAPSKTRVPTAPPTPEARLRAVGTAFLRLRPWIVAPMMANTLAALALSPAPARQVRLLSTMLPLALGFFTWEALRGRSRLVTARWLFASLAATLAALGLACAATGGIGSPALPMLFAPTVITFAAFGRSRQSDAALAALVALLAALTALPPGVPFPPLATRAHRWILLGCALDAAALLRVGVAGLSDAYATSQRALSRASAGVVEATQARTRSLEDLGARVAHEIKNPVAAVRGLVELLREDAADPRQQRRLEVAQGEVARIERILHDYLSFARPLGSLALAQVDLADVARDVALVLEGYAARRGVALDGDGPSLPARADAQRVKEALLNLGLNAVEAAAPGGRVTLAWGARGADVELAVRDTGAGLDAAALAQIGTAFYTTRAGGTGLGVHLARQVAEQHGGSLTFASAPGEGTVATLSLPRDGAGERSGDADDPAV